MKTVITLIVLLIAPAAHALTLTNGYGELSGTTFTHVRQGGALANWDLYGAPLSASSGSQTFVADITVTDPIGPIGSEIVAIEGKLVWETTLFLESTTGDWSGVPHQAAIDFRVETYEDSLFFVPLDGSDASGVLPVLIRGVGTYSFGSTDSYMDRGTNGTLDWEYIAATGELLVSGQLALVDLYEIPFAGMTATPSLYVDVAATVPEPSTALLVGLGLTILAARRTSHPKRA